MKTVFAAALCATALSASLAAAQGYPQQPRPTPGQMQPGHGFREQMDALEARVQEGIRTGQLDRGEADRANREMASIRQEQERMRATGGGELSDMDRGRLQERLDGLSRSIHWMRQNGPGAGQDPRPGQFGQDYQRDRQAGYQGDTRRDGRDDRAGPGMNDRGGDWSLERREGWMQERIGRARADGSLSRRDAYRAQMGLNQIKIMQSRMTRHSGGRLRDDQRQMLEQRLDRLRDTIRWQSTDAAPPWRR